MSAQPIHEEDPQEPPAILRALPERERADFLHMGRLRQVYEVHPKRWAEGWELHISGVGVTQVTDLADAEAAVRDYIALDVGVPADSFGVEIADVTG